MCNSEKSLEEKENMIYYSNFVKSLLCAILFVAAANGAFAAQGDLDLSFDGDGTVTTDNGGTTGEQILDIAIQSDGKIIAVGLVFIDSVARNVLVRYNVNGSIDSSFGTNGKVVIESVFTPKLALQPNGKIVLVGSSGTSPNTNSYVARLNSDGSFDTTFNGTGAVTLDLRGTDDRLSSVKIQPDGKILVGGTSNRPAPDSRGDFAIIRFNADGSLDTALDGDSKVFTMIPPTGESAGIADLAVQPDGKILAAGSVSIVDTPGDDPDPIFAIARYNADGSLDTTFDGDGVANPRFLPASANNGTSTSIPTNIFVKNDGKILVVGRASTCCGPVPTNRTAIVQFNANGSLDTAFADNGKGLITSVSGRDAAIQADNKIVIAGTTGIINRINAAVVRLTANGTLDFTFGGDGQSVIETPPNTTASAVVLQSDGKIIIGGGFPDSNSANGDYFLARYEASSCFSNCFAVRQRVVDFDGDGKTDLSVYRTREWLINPSSANNPNNFYGVNWGLATDKLAAADYDGDGKTNHAVFRENPTDPGKAKFFILQSGTTREEQFGSTGDIPVPGYWDGDDKADIAVYRPGTQANPQSYFFYRPSSQSTVNFISIPFGTVGDKPVVADYDSDGKTDAAVFRPSNGVWYIQRSRDGFAAVQFGASEDKPVVGDYDGDGKADQAVFRPSNGVWYVLRSRDGFAAAQFGVSTDRFPAITTATARPITRFIETAIGIS
jgi:uncharacterized delta-60 repeat protein